MKSQFRKITAVSAVALATLLYVAACGGKETVADKSAKAFREAQQKGIPVAGEGHGGHGAGEESATMTGMDHSTMTGMDHATMTGMDHSTMTAGDGAMAGMDHSKMNMKPGESMAGMDHSKMSMKPGESMAGMDHSKMNMKPGESMAGMDHSKMNMKPGESMAGMDHSKMNMKPGESMAGMDHSKMNMKPGESMAGMDHSTMNMQGQQPMAGMDHGNMPGMQHGAAAAPVVIPPPTSNSEIQQLRPAATLKNDPFDAPAQSAVSEATKAARGSGDAALARGITPGEDRENAATPAPALRDTPAQGTITPPAMDHSQHGGQNPPPPAVATIYTCPMHPEVTSDKPGKCPKCGMTLVKKQ